MSGSIGIVVSIGVSAVLGWFLIVGLLFSIQDYSATVASQTGQPVTQILLDTVGEKGAIALMVCFRYSIGNACPDAVNFYRWLYSCACFSRAFFQSHQILA